MYKSGLSQQINQGLTYLTLWFYIFSLKFCIDGVNQDANLQWQTDYRHLTAESKVSQQKTGWSITLSVPACLLPSVGFQSHATIKLSSVTKHFHWLHPHFAALLAALFFLPCPHSSLHCRLKIILHRLKSNFLHNFSFLFKSLRPLTLPSFFFLQFISF